MKILYSELKLDDGFGGRIKEIIKMFAVNQEKQELAILAQYEKKRGVKAMKCRKEFVF